jgi:hypothetical protein
MKSSTSVWALRFVLSEWLTPLFLICDDLLDKANKLVQRHTNNMLASFEKPLGLSLLKTFIQHRAT